MPFSARISSKGGGQRAADDKEYLDALEKDRRMARTEGIDAVMDKLKLDALVAPTDGPAWVTDLVTGDHFLGGSSTAGGGRGLSEHHGPGGFCLRPAGWDFFLRPGLERAGADQAGLRLRAGDKDQEAAPLFAYGHVARLV